MFVLLILLVAGVLVAPAPPAWACSCAKIDALEFADVAFVGRVTAISTVGAERRVEFAVESVRKGSAGSTLELTTSVSSASCGFDFATGRRYRVFARSGQTGLCSGNQEIPGFGSPAGDPISLGPANNEPRPGVHSGPSSPGRWAPLGIGTLVLAGAATALWISRRRRARPPRSVGRAQ
jgi:hypothetical protein